MASFSPVSESKVHFLALGDWGSSTRNQSNIAKQMAKIVDESNSINTFVAALGDNFYSKGVKSVDDPKWKAIFSEIYSGVRCPWYPILGNHDWQGNVQAQIDFKTDDRWQMDALYYTKTICNVQFFFVDTTSLCPEISEMYTDLPFSEEKAKEQFDWLTNQLEHSTAEWRIVFGHYPIYSGGENGCTHEMKALEAIMFKYKVDAYFCGHDHSLQHLFNKNTSIHYFIAGSGSSTGTLRYVPQYTIAGLLTAGFLNVTIEDNLLNVKFVDSQGNTVYDVRIQKLSSKQSSPTSSAATSI